MKKGTLAVIGEIGNTSKWKDIPLSDYDRVIWIGNIFVSSSNTINKTDYATVRDNAIELLRRKRLNPSKNILLLGKDDLSLIFPETYGNTGALTNMSAQDKTVARSICRTSLKWVNCFHQENNVMFSYAGISASWYKTIIPYLVKLTGAGLTNDSTVAGLLNKGMLMKEFRNALLTDEGCADLIGPFWTDWNDLKMNHVKNLNQVVGANLFKKIQSAGSKNTGQIANVNFLPYCENMNGKDINIIRIMPPCVE